MKIAAEMFQRIDLGTNVLRNILVVVDNIFKRVRLEKLQENVQKAQRSREQKLSGEHLK